MEKIRYIEDAVTLEFDAGSCIGCGACAQVCPHSVFAMRGARAQLVDRGACMECGACALNCPSGAISVTPGVGCAEAIIHSWIHGGEPTCGCSSSGCCSGGANDECCEVPSTKESGEAMSTEEDIKQAVRERYAGHAVQGTSCCGSAPSAETSCCTGYAAADLAAIPAGADLGLGCGNPLAMLELREGETVLDLGSGGGIDCFFAARRVGPTGHVIGVDMTAEMIARARKNAAAGGYGNVEFRLGEIEHLPVVDASVDAIISNCVINLVPDKRQAFAEAARVLRPGGRLSVSDIVTLGDIPLEIRGSMDAYVSCLAGAIARDEYLALLGEAGFEDVRVTEERTFAIEDVVAADLVAEFQRHTGATDTQLREAAEKFASIRVSAIKPV